ncbi:MAG TPA: hypothetical protein ENK11_09655, partial [Phycisphaerales bacterium]|nr:hypothetical protein [Phycisphaerales bacterium]
TTPLSAAQIVLGNLIGRLLFVLALLLASLPLFATTQYFGGVPASSIFASFLIAGCAAFLVGSIAIALSVSRVVGRRAVFTFYVVVISYLAVTAALDSLSGRPGVTWWTGLNPFLALRALLNPASYPRAEPGSLSGVPALFLEHPVTAWCTISAGIGVLLLAASALTVRAGGLRSKTRNTRQVTTADGVVIGMHRAPRHVWPNPIAWREAAARNSTFWKILGRWSFVVAGGLGGLILIAAFHGGAIGPDEFRRILLAVVWTESAVISLIAVNMAATAVSREREDGTLDLILTTPITPSMYLSGKLRGLIAYLLPMLAVPVGTFIFAGGYVLSGGLGRGGVTVPVRFSMSPMQVPLVLPESGLTVGLVLVAFTAFCVMIGLHWSLKSKGTIVSVVGAVGVVGVIAGIVGLCGWQSGSDIQILGPAISAMNPATLLYASIFPESAMLETVVSGPEGPVIARVALLIGAVFSAMIHFGIVFGVRASMVRGFDFTVRKLAGTG